MSSDVGASRIWNRLLDAAFDNSDRRKHGMGIIGRLTTTRRRATRRSPESNRKRKLGGNSGDHRPYFTYWMTFVQIFVLFISLITYGIGPVGIDLYKKAGMVRIPFLPVSVLGCFQFKTVSSFNRFRFLQGFGFEWDWGSIWVWVQMGFGFKWSLV
jgi:hypothetical protein